MTERDRRNDTCTPQSHCHPYEPLDADQNSRLADLASRWRQAADEKRIYGFGLSLALELTPLLKHGLKMYPSVVFDNDPARHGLSKNGFDVRPPQTISTLDRPQIIVFASEYEAIKRQLLGYGLHEYEDFISFSDIVWHYLYLFLNHDVYIPLIQQAVTLRCTLRCENCAMLIPDYAATEDVPIGLLSGDLDLLFRFVGHIQHLGLVGGEPLLAASLAEYIDGVMARHGHRIGEISITTNGTLPPSPELVSVCRKYGRIKFAISDYSGAGIQDYGRKLKAATKVLDDHQIRYAVQNLDWRKLHCDEGKHLRLEPADLRTHCRRCRCGPICPAFHDGRLYPCCVSWSADRCGRLKAARDDRLDLRTLNPASLDDKLQVLLYHLGRHTKGYVDLCRSCYGWDERYRFPVETGRQLSAASRKNKAAGQGEAI